MTMAYASASVSGASVSGSSASGSSPGPPESDPVSCDGSSIGAVSSLESTGGGPELDRDDLWDRYRQAALYPYVAALITDRKSVV